MLEDNWKIYYSNVKSRCLKLIEFGIWSGIDSNKLNGWLNNFKTDQEKYLSACILDSLTFRSQDQVISLLYDLLTRDLNNLFRTQSVFLDRSTNPLISLQNKWIDPCFRIVSAVKNEDPPSKSGNLMNSHLVHHLDVCEKWTINPNMIEKAISAGIKHFVIIDDIICTGEQICSTILEWNIPKYADIHFYIAACVAHESGVNKLRTDFPNIAITYAEELKISDSFFENLDIISTDYIDKDDAFMKYEEFLKDKGCKYKEKLGFGQLGLIYGFIHNVPNATLPIIHYHSEKFNSLLKKK